MANHHRGEIEAVLDGTPHRLCLTLGALADLEAAFGDEDMLALARRFEGGRLSARDCVRIIAAGLRGSGHSVTDDTVARMQADGGVAGFIDIVARLLTITFGGSLRVDTTPALSIPERPSQSIHDASLPPRPSQHRPGLPNTSRPEVPGPVPFPGTR